MTSPRPSPPMCVILAMLMAAAAPAWAQTYRIVAPDGRVTYSDRRPTDPKLQATTLGQAPPPPPLFASGPLLLEPPAAGTSAPAGTPSPARPANGAPVAATRNGNAPTPTSASGRPFPPGLPDAILNVIGRQNFVQTLWDLCTRNRPASFALYDDAVQAWRQRNAPMIRRTDRVVYATFTADQRSLLLKTAQSRLQPVMAPVWKAPSADQARWCDRTTADLVHGRLDLIADARLTGPIMAYDLP